MCLAALNAPVEQTVSVERDWFVITWNIRASYESGAPATDIPGSKFSFVKFDRLSHQPDRTLSSLIGRSWPVPMVDQSDEFGEAIAVVYNLCHGRLLRIFASHGLPSGNKALGQALLGTAPFNLRFSGP